MGIEDPLPGSLVELARRRLISPEAIDVIMLAWGRLTVELAHRYIRGDREDEVESAAAVEEVVGRLLECQVHDGGRTTLLSNDERVVVEVGGRCTTCPRIPYTLRILDRAIQWRSASVTSFIAIGVDSQLRHSPEQTQLSMSGLMRETGMTFGDLDRLLSIRGELVDDDIARLGALCESRSRADSVD